MSQLLANLCRLRSKRLSGNWRAKGTPAEIINKLNKEVNAGLADPKMKARFAEAGGYTPVASSPRRIKGIPREGRREMVERGKVRRGQGGLFESNAEGLLDYVLPEDLVLSALAHSERMCFLCNNGIMRSRRASSDDVPISLAEDYRRYGGDALEDNEYGSVAVPTA